MPPKKTKKTKKKNPKHKRSKSASQREYTPPRTSVERAIRSTYSSPHGDFICPTCSAIATTPQMESKYPPQQVVVTPQHWIVSSQPMQVIPRLPRSLFPANAPDSEDELDEKDDPNEILPSSEPISFRRNQRQRSMTEDEMNRIWFRPKA